MCTIWLTDERINTIVDLYADMVLRIAYQNTKNKADAEDITQDVFMRLAQQTEFDSEEHVKAWLIRVAINRCKDLHKSAWKRKVVLLQTDWPLLTESQQDVMEELFLLKPQDRNVLYLYYYEQYTIAEIAQILGEKLNTVNSRISRARKKLKDVLLEGGYNHG